jgi:hypothetical protein
MADRESEMLCAHLTGVVGNKAADEFYKEFNLTSTSFAEYYFKEMIRIFHLPGMEDWPKLNIPNDSPPMSFSLVFFKPPEKSKSSSRSVLQRRVCTAHDMVLAMLSSCFGPDEDKECIRESMEIFPTVAVFMTQVGEKGMIKRQPKQRKSILDVKDSSSLHCLAAAVYFRDVTHTQVLWLATTLEAPPPESMHVTWRKCGLATYLLCMLVKQHTGILSNMDHSVLSLQASSERKNPVRNFYLKLGFICHDEYLDDNGLSKTSKGFQEQVKKYPKVWVSPERDVMSLFQLFQGRLSLKKVPELIDFYNDDSSTDSNDDGTWQGYAYAYFPCKTITMSKYEEYLESRPILKCMSGDSCQEQTAQCFIKDLICQVTSQVNYGQS